MTVKSAREKLVMNFSGERSLQFVLLASIFVLRSNEEKCLFGQYGVFICSTWSGHRKNKIARHLIAILVSSFYNSPIGCCRLRDQQKMGRRFDACVCKKALVRRCVPREAARLLCLYTRTQRSRFVLNGTIKLFKENADERASERPWAETISGEPDPPHSSLCLSPLSHCHKGAMADRQRRAHFCCYYASFSVFQLEVNELLDLSSATLCE